MVIPPSTRKIAPVAWRNTLPVRVVPSEPDRPSTGAGGGGGPGSERLRRSLWFEAEGIEYAGELTVTLDEGSLVVDFAGEARSAFRRNRVGLVVLHPAGCAGSRVDVRHSDGRVEDARWPVALSPHQPFVDVAGFGWRADGVVARLTLRATSSRPRTSATGPMRRSRPTRPRRPSPSP